MRLKTLLLFTTLLLAFPSAAIAQARLSVDIYGAGQRTLNMVIVKPMGLDGTTPGPMAEELDELIRTNLSFLPFIADVPQQDLLGGAPATGVGVGDIDFRPLVLAKVDLIMTQGWRGDTVELRVFETFNRRRLVGKAYNNLEAPLLPDVADRFCGQFMKALTGKGGFFESTLAFVKKVAGGKAKELFVVRPQGRGLRQITRLGGYNISPSWSKDGERLVFTHIDDDGHRLGVWDRETGKTVLKSYPGFTVVGPAFDPDGNVAVTLDKSGNPDIYLIDEDFRLGRRLAPSWAIEVSPNFDKSGRFMVFASGRLGNPHIFVLDKTAGTVQRVTMQGTYNTSPSLSPDGRFVTFSRQTASGHKIFVHDLATGRERQLTFGPGDDEDPAFGPDGYFVAFSSNRGGGEEYHIYMTTRHGDAPMRVPTGRGSATMPAWDTANRF